MAGAYLISTMKRAMSKLSSLISSDIEEDAFDFEMTMKRIHDAVLDYAEERDIIDKSERFRLLRELVYDVEDVVDDYEHEVLRVKVQARREAMAARGDDKRDEVLDWNSFCPQVSFPDDLIYRMRESGERFEMITNGWNKISLLRKEGKTKSEKTTPSLDESMTFGRKDEKDKIVEWLLEEKNDPHTISVLPIIGMGGIGKTALAQLVYNDPRVTRRFDLRAWICVSDDFDVVGLIKDIVTSFSMKKDDEPDLHLLVSISNMNSDVLCRFLKKKVQGKKFFIVLDDVWNLKLDLWRSLKSTLGGVGLGKIVLTTRNASVAKIMQTTGPIVLKELPFDDCLSLFKTIAFRGRDHNLLQNLLDIGSKIVEKCKGLPLAVMFLGSILIFEDREHKWNDVLESQFWEFEDGNNNVLYILKRSYDRMPTELQQCFKYLSLFRKDSVLEKETVVQQWMSQGFLQAQGKQTEEDVGHSYINDLLEMSILQYSTSSKDCFVMHDLIHDLAQFVAKDEYLLITIDKLDRHPKDSWNYSTYCHISKL